MSKETFKEFVSNINPESLEKTRKSMEEAIRKEAIEEAAEEYENDLGYYECINQWPKTSFIAGAEFMYLWMIKEFVVIREVDFQELLDHRIKDE